MPSNEHLLRIGGTSDVESARCEEHWREIFGSLWGDLDLTSVHDGQLFGSLHSRKIGELTFNRIEFGNQQFERATETKGHEPFYSLTFPETGHADFQIGDRRARLLPQNVYLLNNGLAAKLRIDKTYSTFNVQIPISSLEFRLGRRTDIMSRQIVQPDSIYHMMQSLISELMTKADDLDDGAASFMTNQMLDTVAFFLSAGGGMSEDTLAVQAARARILAFLNANFRDASLTPGFIAGKCGMSRSYLYKLFAEGPSVMEQLRRRRLEAARGMIEFQGRKLSMTEIAMACGFSSSSEFSRLFKKEFGVAPSRL